MNQRHASSGFERIKKKIRSIFYNAQVLYEVEVGYPKGSARYPGNSTYGKFHTPPNVIEVAFWNNYGTKTIPARPFFTTACSKMQKECSPYLVETFKNLNLDSIKERDIRDNLLYNLHRLGAFCVGVVQKEIRDWKIPENSKITVYGGWVYNKKAKKSVFVKGKRANNPLVDTGWLQKCVQHVVRTKDYVPPTL